MLIYFFPSDEKNTMQNVGRIVLQTKIYKIATMDVFAVKGKVKIRVIDRLIYCSIKTRKNSRFCPVFFRV